MIHPDPPVKAAGVQHCGSGSDAAALLHWSSSRFAGRRKAVNGICAAFPRFSGLLAGIWMPILTNNGRPAKHCPVRLSGSQGLMLRCHSKGIVGGFKTHARAVNVTASLPTRRLCQPVVACSTEYRPELAGITNVGVGVNMSESGIARMTPTRLSTESAPTCRHPWRSANGPLSTERKRGLEGLSHGRSRKQMETTY